MNHRHKLSSRLLSCCFRQACVLNRKRIITKTSSIVGIRQYVSYSGITGSQPAPSPEEIIEECLVLRSSLQELNDVGLRLQWYEAMYWLWLTSFFLWSTILEIQRTSREDISEEHCAPLRLPVRKSFIRQVELHQLCLPTESADSRGGPHWRLFHDHRPWSCGCRSRWPFIHWGSRDGVFRAASVWISSSPSYEAEDQIKHCHQELHDRRYTRHDW